MLTLRNQEEEAVPGLTDWLTSANPVEQLYAAECLAEMGDTHGTDCLILLASTEDRKRRKPYFVQSVLLWMGCLVLYVFPTVLRLPSLCGMVAIIPIQFIIQRTMKSSRLQQAAVERLADQRNPAAVGALVDALWRAEPDLREAALQGLIKLLPRAGNDLRLSKKQWDLLLSEINPSTLSRQKTMLNSKFVLAVLQAVVAAEYFPAIPRVKALASSRKTFWTDSMIRSSAIHCYAVLEQARLTEMSVRLVRTPP